MKIKERGMREGEGEGMKGEGEGEGEGSRDAHCSRILRKTNGFN